MTRRPVILRLTAVLGFVVGVTGLVTAASGWRVAAGDGLARTSLTLVANHTGTLEMAPAGAFLSNADVSVNPARGRLRLRNQTGRALWVRLRVRPSSRDLGRRLTIVASADGVPIHAGSLAALERWTTRRVRIRAGAWTRLEVEVASTRGTGRGVLGRVEQLDVQFDARPVRS